MASYFFGSPAAAEDEQQYCFNAMGMELSIVPTMPQWSSIPSMLVLAGVGMRDVYLIITSIDVYLVGFYLSESAIEAAQGWDDISDSEITLSIALLPLSSESIPEDGSFGDAGVANSEEVRMCVVQQFKRAVSKADFLAAFNTTMHGCEERATMLFLDALGGLITEERGILLGDEVHFYWLQDGRFAVKFNTTYAGPVCLTKQIYLRLLEAYVDPTRTVSPALSQCIHAHVSEIEF